MATNTTQSGILASQLTSAQNQGEPTAPASTGYNSTSANTVNSGSTGYAATGATGTGYNATNQAPAATADTSLRTINPATDTVQGQLTSLIDPNNPYFQQWSTAGKQMAAANGFTNGSLQQTGILNSVMQNATPIATADAG